jgi:hypothetical protein
MAIGPRIIIHAVEVDVSREGSAEPKDEPADWARVLQRHS